SRKPKKSGCSRACRRDTASVQSTPARATCPSASGFQPTSRRSPASGPSRNRPAPSRSTSRHRAPLKRRARISPAASVPPASSESAGCGALSFGRRFDFDLLAVFLGFLVLLVVLLAVVAFTHGDFSCWLR